MEPRRWSATERVFYVDGGSGPLTSVAHLYKYARGTELLMALVQFEI